MLPIVQRELRVAARSPRLYRKRFWFGLLSVLVVAIAVTTSSGSARTGGPNLFNTLSVLAWLFCMLEGVRKTSDAISEEKREGTLGFLFLTELRGFDIVIGKLAGSAVRSFSGLLVFLPVLATSLLIGGVMPGEFWRMVLGLLSVLFFSLSVGLLVSTWSLERSTAATVMSLTGITVLPLLLEQLWHALDPGAAVDSLSLISPVSACVTAMDATYVRRPGLYWWSIGALHAMGWGPLIAASVSLRYVWQRRGAAIVRATVRRRSKVTAAKRASLLDENPFLWMAWDPRDSRFFHIIFWTGSVIYLAARTFGAGAGLLLEPIPSDYAYLALAGLFLVMYLASQATVTLALCKRSGALELLLSTPLRPEAIVEGQRMALWKMFGVPFTVLMGGCLIVLAFHAMQSGLGSLQAIWMAQYPLAFGVTCGAIMNTGIWMALKTKTPNRAYFATFALCVVLPYMISCLPVLLVELVLYFVSRKKAVSEFRRLVVERYQQTPAFVLAAPGAQGGAAPPVLR